MNATLNPASARRQAGGTALGVIVGVLVGLIAALGVAVYVTKVPVPFVNKGSGRGAEQDAAEVKKNKDWDPNAPLYGKVPVKPNAVSSGAVGASEGVAAPSPVAPAASVASVAKPSASAPSVKSVDEKPSPSAKAEAPKSDAPKVVTPAKAASSSDPIGDLAKAKTKGNPDGLDPFVYFVQIGAYNKQEDADSQKAKLALAGLDGKITEREVSGRTVFRVRVGPIDKKDDANKIKERIEAAGLEGQLIGVNR